MSDWDLPHEYAILAAEACIQPEGAAYADAKAWLEAHDREVAARALRDAARWLGDAGAVGMESLLCDRADRLERGEDV